jgi:hypothetical protein
VKLNEFNKINEGIMSNIASFTRGALNIPRPNDPRLMVTDFIKRATDGIKLGIQTGKIAEPGATPTVNMPSISKWLADFTSQYMGPSRESAGIDISGLQQVIKNATISVENSYRQDQGKKALTALATTLHDTAAKAYAGPSRNPKVSPTTSQVTPVSTKKPKVNYADYQKQLAAKRAAKPAAAPTSPETPEQVRIRKQQAALATVRESKQKIVKKWGEK